MKILLISFGILLLAVYTTARCAWGCSCVNDDPCEYYCSNYTCRSAIPLWAKCSGYYIHPRECGTVSFCDPAAGYTCQLQKNWGEGCTYSYSCLSGYCDTRTWTCKSSNDPSNWVVPIFLPSMIGISIFVIILVVIVRCRIRRRALRYYQTPYVVIPANTPCSYQNSCPVGEGMPPPYPDVHASPASYPKSYQG